MKPVINLDALEMESCDDGPFRHRYGVISDRIGAIRLGYNLTVVPPGARACPFHNHHNNEELFIVIAGTGTLRFGEETYPLRAQDIVACPPGTREVAHQIINTGDTDLSYIAISTKDPVEVAEFPDTDSLRVIVGDYGKMVLRGDYEADKKVSIEDRERRALEGGQGPRRG